MEIVNKDGTSTHAVSEKGRKLSKYNEQEVDLILHMLALNGGNYPKTARQVEGELNISIHPNTLYKWATNSFPSRYAEIQHSLADKIDDTVLNTINAVTLRGADAQSRLLDQLDSRLDEGEQLSIKDLAPTLRNMAVVGDLNLKQKRLLEDKPTQITEARTIEQVISELEADEIIAEVVDD